MKAIKIDVEQKKVYEIEIDGNNKSMYEALKCSCVSHISIIRRKEFLWIDDDGLLKDNPLGAFELVGYPQLLSGNGLILGIDIGGNNISTAFDAETIKSLVKFEDAAKLPKPFIKVYSLD